MFVFVDEASKDRNALRKRRAWAKRGKPCDVTEAFDVNSESHYTLLAAADINGFIPEMCDFVFRKRHAADPDPTRGTVGTERFFSWVDHFLVPHLGRCDELEPRSVVIADNASIHMDPRFVEKVEAAGAMVLFLPPFSPDLQPGRAGPSEASNAPPRPSPSSQEPGAASFGRIRGRSKNRRF